MQVRRILTLVVLLGALAAPPTAHADPFDDAFADYQKDGRISACRHSERDLQQALGQVPSDIEQYAPDFPDALQAALEERARKDCGKASGGDDGSAVASPDGGNAAGHGGDGATRNDALGTASPEVVPAPEGTAVAAAAASDGAIATAAARGAGDGSSAAPAPLVALAALVGLLLLLALAWGVARFLAWDPRWLVATRHAVAEAGWRAGTAWEDFRDWIRRGRPSSAR